MITIAGKGDDGMSAQKPGSGRLLAEGERYETGARILDDFFTPAWRNIPPGFASAAGRDFAQLCVEHCYADAWARDTLDRKTRSIITLSALAAMGCTEELKMHVRVALSVGHTPDDIVEFLIQLIPYVGVPRMVQAMRCAAEVLAQAAQTKQA
jgi:4-carboxymuconolactone decarboxylase